MFSNLARNSSEEPRRRQYTTALRADLYVVEEFVSEPYGVHILIETKTYQLLVEEGVFWISFLNV